MYVPMVDVGLSKIFFSVGFNHGGYFLGTGSNRAYINGSINLYDHVDKGSWSPSVVESIVEDIGYEMTGRIKVHFCV